MHNEYNSLLVPAEPLFVEVKSVLYYVLQKFVIFSQKFKSQTIQNEQQVIKKINSNTKPQKIAKLSLKKWKLYYDEHTLTNQTKKKWEIQTRQTINFC